MSQFYEDTLRGLKEAIAIEESILPVTEKRDMPGATLYVEPISGISGSFNYYHPTNQIDDSTYN